MDHDSCGIYADKADEDEHKAINIDDIHNENHAEDDEDADEDNDDDGEDEVDVDEEEEYEDIDDDEEEEKESEIPDAKEEDPQQITESIDPASDVNNQWKMER